MEDMGQGDDDEMFEETTPDSGQGDTWISQSGELENSLEDFCRREVIESCKMKKMMMRVRGTMISNVVIQKVQYSIVTLQ